MSEKTLQPIEQQEVQFYGDELTAVRLATGEVYVPIRPICDNLGTSWTGQRERINRDPVLAEEVRGVRVTRAPGIGGGSQEMLCLPLKFIPGWLFGINANRVKSEIRERLIQYQRECYDVLSEAFQEGRLTADPIFAELLQTDSEAVQAYQMLQALVKLARNQIMLEGKIDHHTQALEDHGRRLETIEADMGQTDRRITESQATQISQGIRTVALIMSKRSGRNEYGACWGEFYRKFGVSKYRHLPAAKFDEAVKFLEEWHTSLVNEAF